LERETVKLFENKKKLLQRIAIKKLLEIGKEKFRNVKENPNEICKRLNIY